MSQYTDLKLLIDVQSAHKKILEVIKKGSRVLEIGTNTGYMSKYLYENLQCEVTGIEIDSDSLAKASPYLHRALNINVDDLYILEKSLVNSYYDYIIMSDVLEHLINTNRILDILSSKIKKDGEIIISMPNANHNIMLMQLLKNDFSYQKVGFLDKTHVKFFTTKSFYNLLAESNLEIVKHTYTYMTPMFEDIPHNNYSEFSLFEKEVLLRHENGHFFQNIFSLKKKDNLNNKQPIQNIDSYWFDQVEITINNNQPIFHDVFDLNINLKITLPKNVSNISFKPSMRLRGIKDLHCYINEDEINFEMKNFITINQTHYSFNDTRIELLIPKKINTGNELSIKLQYVDITEDQLRNIFLKAATL